MLKNVRAMDLHRIDQRQAVESLPSDIKRKEIDNYRPLVARGAPMTNCQVRIQPIYSPRDCQSSALLRGRFPNSAEIRVCMR